MNNDSRWTPIQLFLAILTIIGGISGGLYIIDRNNTEPKVEISPLVFVDNKDTGRTQNEVGKIISENQPSTVQQPSEEAKVNPPVTIGRNEANSNSGDIKQKQMLTQTVYFESEEKNLTQQSTIIANRLKQALSIEGYSFTDNRAQARFRLKITATTRHHGTEYGLTICYADVAVGLFDVSNNKSVFQDEFSQKGISSTREAAGRKALEDAVPMIANKVPTWSEIIRN